MFEISLFLFLGSYLFFLWPTLMRQLTAMQEADYFYEKFIVFMKAQRKIESMWVMVAFIAANLVLQRFFALPVYLILHAVGLAILGLLHLRKPKEKKPVMDRRMIALCAAAGSLFLLIFLTIGIFFRSTFFWEMPFIISFLGFMSDTWMLLGNWLTMPFEKGREKKQAALATAKIESVGRERAKAGKAPLAVVGVAGSYGKSGLISAASVLLGGKMRVLASDPGRLGSINSAGELLSQNLTADHDVALIEIMARHPGDIEAFGKAIPVNAGAITSAAERNLETFLSPERLTETLMELTSGVHAAKEGEAPVVAVNYNDERLRKQKAEGVELLRYGSYKGDVLPQHLDVFAKNLDCTLSGTTFTLCTRQGRELACRVPQLGSLYAEAAIGAAALALRLGLTLEDVQKGLQALPPQPGYVAYLPEGGWPEQIRKRLAKPWETDGEKTRQKAQWRFLENTDETNLESARDSLALLASFPGYRVLLTMGMHGQGSKEDETNRLLGRAAAKCANAIVVIGKDKFSVIEDGAQRAGFAMGDLHLALNLTDALNRISALAADAGRKACVLALGRF